jgi:transcriptional regulator with XRE-family HTH domain
MRNNNGRRSRLAEEIRAELARQQKSRTDLAAAMGVSLNTLTSRLNGRYPFLMDEVAAVAAFLGMTASELIARTEVAA